ncbi:hypothetical protein WT01_27235 [Burkholderia cepacia]|nr:hypothetical protein WT01_27235 [Burkholderia cepacia]
MKRYILARITYHRLQRHKRDSFTPCHLNCDLVHRLTDPTSSSERVKHPFPASTQLHTHTTGNIAHDRDIRRFVACEANQHLWIVSDIFQPIRNHSLQLRWRPPSGLHRPDKRNIDIAITIHDL